MNEFYGNAQQSTETQDDFDLDIRLKAVDAEANEPTQLWVSRGTNCSTCFHTSPKLCC
jgi:hypothetical protein